MITVNSGGPAFPVSEAHGCNSGAPGQSLRDAFAMRAMQAAEPPKFYISATQTQMSLEAWARHCWAMADAMLAARGIE